MHEIKIKIKGNGTVDTGFRERLRIGVANEINRVKFVFELDNTIEGSYHYIKFLKDDISYIYRVYNKEIIINKSILVDPGIWIFSFIATDNVINNKQITGNYAFISEPTETVVINGILQKGHYSEETDAIKSLYSMNFRELRIPNSVTEIGGYFLYDSRMSFDLYIGAGVKSIGGYTFYKSTIGKIVFAEHSELETLSDYAFYNLTLESEITIPASVRTWGKHCFQHTDPQVIRFESGSNIQELGSYAFWDMETKKIYLPDNLKVLSGNTYVFSHVDSLEYVWIPNTITTTIPANAFSTAPSLTVIELQEGFNISANFSNCTNLSKEAIVNMLYALKNLKGTSAKSLTLGETNLAKLSANDIAIATNKNWTLS